jgi:L-threonylcarbamoyladenylate synthase
MIHIDSSEARELASRLVAAGGVFAFRTDTFYGLGADPFSAAALQTINELKGREGKPILVLLSEGAAAARLLEGTGAVFDALAGRLWPGPLTLVGKARPNLPELLTAGTGTIGVRLPSDEDVRVLVRACGGALTATSANPAGLPPARTAQEAADYFAGRLELVVDGGAARTDLPSTVLDVSGEGPRLIREGVLSKERIGEVLRELGIVLG